MANTIPIIPSPGYALVEIINKYESGLMAEDERFAYVGEGKLSVAVKRIISSPDAVELGKLGDGVKYTIPANTYVYFEPVPVSEIVERDGRRFVIIKVESINGAEND